MVWAELPRRGVWTHELKSMRTAEACSDRKWDRQAQAGRRHSTVQSLMAYRHCCIMFMDALQTESILTARLNNSLLKFFFWKVDGETKKRETCPCVKQQGRTMVILQATCHQLNPHNSWCVSFNGCKSTTKTLYSYLFSHFCVYAVMIIKTVILLWVNVLSWYYILGRLRLCSPG